MGVGARFGAGGAAAEAFWVFWESSVEGGERFLAGLVRMVMRGGEGVRLTVGEGFSATVGRERVLAGLVRMVMCMGGAWRVRDGWVS